MSAPPPPRRHRHRFPLFAEIGIAIAVLLAALWFARYTLGTVFRSWDDEGYMLLSLRGYLSGHPLYSDTFTQYGPFYFFAQALSFRLPGLSLTHDAGRFVTLLDWMLFASLGGALVYKLSRNVLLAASCVACCTLLGSVLANEPGHPQQIVVVLFALSLCLAAWAEARPAIALFLLGAVGSALLFTKINLGVLYFAALAPACVALLPRGTARKVALAALLVGATSLPFFLMRSHLPTVKSYFVSATLCIGATLVLGSFRKSAAPLPWKTAGVAVAGAVLAGLAIVATTLAQGVSLHWLIEGVVLAPSKHPAVLFIPLWLSRSAEAWTAVALTAMAILAALAFRDRPKPGRHWPGAVRCAAGIVAVVAIMSSQNGLVWAAPLLPATLMPHSQDRHWRDLFLPLFAAGLAALQFLGAYPVAGSQVAISAVPALLCGFICISNWPDRLRLPLRAIGLRREIVFTGVSILALSSIGLRLWHDRAWPRPWPYPASHLPGAASLHLPPRVEARYAYLSAAVHRNCDLLFTSPGMGSFNLWSGVPSPDASNVTVWVKLLPPDRQRRIIEILQAHPRSCVISYHDNDRFWQIGARALAASPLESYIVSSMPVTAASGPYSIRVHPRREVPWIQ